MKDTFKQVEKATEPVAHGSGDVVAYVEEVTRIVPLSLAEEAELGRSIIRDRCPVARAQLLRANLRLVVPIARQFARKGYALGTLINEGNIGLAWAVEEFDPEQGVRFSTFATWWIKHAIRRITVGRSENMLASSPS